MPLDKKLLAKLGEAEDADQEAYVRFLCEEILAAHPDHALTLVRYARVLISFAQYEKAAEALDRAEALIMPERLHWVLGQRGHLLAHTGDFDLAEAEYLDAHQLEPEQASYLIYAGSVAFRRGDLRRAEELARQATQCRDGCIDEAYFNLGGYLLSQQRYAEARECYVRAIEIDPDYEIARERLDDVDCVLKAGNVR